jgi:pyridoxal phosphate enzyme (YggS family)
MATVTETDIQTNLRRIRDRIADASARAGRDPSSVTLVAVTKTQSVQHIRSAYDLGLRDFGENRVEEADQKLDLLPADVRWHMIGHVQSRKAIRVAGRYALVHSVDSIRLARRLSRFGAEAKHQVPILLEVNVSGEASKYGLTPETVEAAVEVMVELPKLQIRGLMTMAPIVPDPELTRPVFASLRLLRDQLSQRFPQCDWGHLSMGMTDDFEVAVEEGATLLRIGRAIFGERH